MLRYGGGESGDKLNTEFEQLLEHSRELAKTAVPENTVKAYSSDFKIFIEWCDSHGLESLPATVPTIAAYVAQCARRELSMSTVSRYLTVISKTHELAQFPNPTKDPMVTEAVKGYRRERGTEKKRVKPLLFEQLTRIVEQLGTSIKGLRDSAILTVGWMGALRRSEIVALMRDDIESVSEGLVVHVRRSKTDQEGKGRKIGIPFGTDRFCPVTIIRRWYTIAQIEQGPLFFGVYRGASAKMFSTKNFPRRKLNDRTVAEIVKQSLELAGYDSVGYSGHSLRAGFCTSAASCGVPEHVIMRHTGHRSDAVMRGYIREGELFTTNPLLAVLGTAPVLPITPEILPHQEHSPEAGENLLPAHESTPPEAGEETAQSS